MENQVSTAQLVVVSCDSEVQRVVWTVAKSNLWRLIIASNAWDAMEKLRSDLEVDVLLIDLPPGEADSFRCLRWLRHLRPALPILLIDRAPRARAKLHSVRIESGDYLVAPLSPPQIQIGIQQGLLPARVDSEMAFSRYNLEAVDQGWNFVSAGPKMRRVSAQAALFAQTNLPVFISGEPGSGKETIARLLHLLSDCSGSPFTKVDCAALSPELLKLEIFGYEPAYGLAEGTVLGKLNSNARGIIFLDEIAEIPLELQSKLAAVIESGQFIRRATSQAGDIDVRVVAASSLSVDTAIAEHRMIPALSRLFEAREIRIPPLRERREELPVLARHFADQLSRQCGLAPRAFAVEMEEAWQMYSWPGNLRELKQAVKQYLAGGEAAVEIENRSHDQRGFRLSAVPDHSLRGNVPRAPSDHAVTDIACYKSLRSMLRSVKERAERAAIAATLEKTGWNRKAAARLLKISYRSILYKIEQYEMNSPGTEKFGGRHAYHSADTDSEKFALPFSERGKSNDVHRPNVPEHELVQGAGNNA